MADAPPVRMAGWAVLLAIVLLAAVGGAGAGAQAPPRPPNVVVVMTDDQTYEQLAAMPNVESLLVERGTSFTRQFATLPLCCPSRATFLTGQYAHSHGVLENHEPFGGWPVFKGREPTALPVWLQRAGYRTALIGKYLNAYPDAAFPTEIPPGWDRWFAPVFPSETRYYDYRVNDQGTLAQFGFAPEDYSTDVFAGRAVAAIEQFAAGRDPFFLWFTPRAPHTVRGPELPNPPPAPRHAGAFDGFIFPRPPSFNERRIADKPGFVRDNPRLGLHRRTRVYARARDTRASLLAVDEAVARIVSALEVVGELDDTVIMFTSDNGFFFGEHRLFSGKEQIYEEAIHVPLVVRGPGFPAGARVSAPSANVDLAATIAALTGATPLTDLEGVPLNDLVRDPAAGARRGIVIESRLFSGLRTRRYTYAEHEQGGRELYDLKADPFELQNLAREDRYRPVRAALADVLAERRDCLGAACVFDVEPPAPAPEEPAARNRGRRAG